MNLNPVIFRSTEEVLGLFDSLFGGLFVVKGVPITFQLLLYALFPFFILLVYTYCKERNRLTANLAKCCACIIFTLATLLLFQPWDEAFVNLRHSYHFAHSNTFSFNASHPVEGTVDFLPYLLLGFLVKLGFPLIEMVYLQGLLGGMLCIYLGRKILSKLDFPHANISGMLALICYVPLVLNSSHGFTTTLFTVAILGSIYHLFFDKKINLGCFFLALIPTIRIEGVFYVFVVAIVFFRTIPLRKLLLVMMPCLILWGWKYSYFGSLLPVPIQFKSSLGNMFYFVIGMRNLISDLVATHAMTSIFVIALMAIALPSRQEIKTAYRILFALFLFTIPYYLSGGDWFPPSWGRYLFPFAYFSFLLCLVRLAEYLRVVDRPNRGLVLVILLCVFLIESVPSFGAYHRFYDYALAPRKILAEIRPKMQPAIPYRVQYLSQVGQHFLKNSEKTDRIASSEIATIHYFAEREAIDLLGITNSEIASEPLRETPSLWRHSPRENELPYLIFKRLNPHLIEKHKPEFIYPFDFMIATILKDVPFEEWTHENILLAYKRWQNKFKGLTRPIYGELNRLFASGYSPVIVIYGNEFSALYFVSDAIRDRHFAQLKASGFVRD